MKKDLDHDQEKTDSLIKSANPDKGILEKEHLCRKCHGPLNNCKCLREGSN